MFQSKLTVFGTRWLAFMASLFILSASVEAGRSRGELCLFEGYSDQEIARYSVDSEGTFSLSFIHSVSLTPVVDIYEIKSTGIHQIAEMFEAHGAGLPSFAGDVGAKGWRRQDGKFVLDMDRQFDRIQLRIQREYLNILHLSDQDITLADFGASRLGIAICAN